MSKFTIQISGERNENLYFTPAGQHVRGEWHVSKVAHREQSVAVRALSKLVSIPGMTITIDMAERCGTIDDPLLSSKEGRETWAKAQEIFQEHEESFGGQMKLREKLEFKDLTIDQVKTWSHMMVQLIDMGIGKPVGKHPTIEIVAKMPGKRIKDPGNTGSKDKDLKEFEFVDEVPVA